MNAHIVKGLKGIGWALLLAAVGIIASENRAHPGMIERREDIPHVGKCRAWDKVEAEANKPGPDCPAYYLDAHGKIWYCTRKEYHWLRHHSHGIRDCFRRWWGWWWN